MKGRTVFVIAHLSVYVTVTRSWFWSTDASSSVEITKTPIKQKGTYYQLYTGKLELS